MNQHIESVILQFDIPDGAWTAEPYGNGHINDTYLIAAGEKHFILQRVNGYVFPKPEDVIENIERVTDFLKEQIAQEGGDPERETLTLVKTQQGTHFAYDEQGNLWRMYLFIEDAVSRRSAGDAGAVRALRRGFWQVPASDGRVSGRFAARNHP